MDTEKLVKLIREANDASERVLVVSNPNDALPFSRDEVATLQALGCVFETDTYAPRGKVYFMRNPKMETFYMRNSEPNSAPHFDPKWDWLVRT
jgi:hypothetical protein